MLSFFPLSISLLYYCFSSQNFPLTVSDLNCLLYRLDSLKAWFTKTFPLWMAIPDSFHWSKIPFKKSCISNFFSTSWFPPPPPPAFLFVFILLPSSGKQIFQQCSIPHSIQQNKHLKAGIFSFLGDSGIQEHHHLLL